MEKRRIRKKRNIYSHQLRGDNCLLYFYNQKQLQSKNDYKLYQKGYAEIFNPSASDTRRNQEDQSTCESSLNSPAKPRASRTGRSQQSLPYTLLQNFLMSIYKQKRAPSIQLTATHSFCWINPASKITN